MTTFKDIQDVLDLMPPDDHIRQWYEVYMSMWLSHLDPLDYEAVGSASIRKTCKDMNRKERAFLEDQFKKFINICPIGKPCMRNGGEEFSQPCLSCSAIWYDSLYPNDPAPFRDKFLRMSKLYGPGVEGIMPKWKPHLPKK